MGVKDLKEVHHEKLAIGEAAKLRSEVIGEGNKKK